MLTIKEHIKKNEFRSIYLLTGTEDYLKKLYQKKLKSAILTDSDDMNYSYFEGKGLDISRIVESAQTLPFFAKKRLIVVKNSGLFKTSNDLAEFIKTMPETTCLIFIETEIDKRNRLYKAVKEVGYISEMNGMDERNLKLWVSSLFQKEGKKMTEQTIRYLLSNSGTDMELLSNEIEKLICYRIDREVITSEDIDAVCTTLITGKIFQMIDAIAMHQSEEALKLYNDLLKLREKPMSILFLLTRHFNLLYQVGEFLKLKENNGTIAKKLGVPPFAVNKYISQAKSFENKKLVRILDDCLSTEEQVKTGHLLDYLGIELMIVTNSTV